MDFVVGLIVGVCIGVVGLFAVAWRLANKANAKPEAAPQGVAAVGVSMDRKSGIQSLDPFHQRMMKDIIERIEGQA